MHDPMVRDAKKRGLKKLIQDMAHMMKKGKGDQTMAKADLKSHIAGSTDGAADPEDEKEDTMEPVSTGDLHEEEGEPEGAEGEHGGEPAIGDEVKNFMKRSLHNNRPDEKGSKLVVRMISAEPNDRAPKPHKQPSKPNRFTGRR